jgi:hypothetical protein
VTISVPKRAGKDKKPPAPCAPALQASLFLGGHLPSKPTPLKKILCFASRSPSLPLAKTFFGGIRVVLTANAFGIALGGFFVLVRGVHALSACPLGLRRQMRLKSAGAG